jgi:WD40 repeat protein
MQTNYLLSVHSIYTEPFNAAQGGPGASVDTASKSSWRPRENVLVASLLEHTHSVNHVAVAADQCFFATASADKTVKVWKVRGLDSSAFPRLVDLVACCYAWIAHNDN